MKGIDRYIFEKLKLNKDSKLSKNIPQEGDKILTLQTSKFLPAHAFPGIIKSISDSEFIVEYIGAADEIPIFRRAACFKIDDNPINDYIGICKDEELKNFICYPSDFCQDEIKLSGNVLKIDGNTISIPDKSNVNLYKQKLLNHFKDK